MQIEEKCMIKEYLKTRKEIVDRFIKEYFSLRSPSTTLHDAMTYSLFAGGKRLRPILTLTSNEACGGEPEKILHYAGAIELIHTYSLIHDDLPSMDDDDLRRGKPSNHKVFGEAMAILAGDALLTEAFTMLSCCQSNGISSASSLRAIYEISHAAGPHGMVAGQAEDILAEESEPNFDTLTFIHKHKTGALITTSVRVGAILADADNSDIESLTEYGNNIGIAFQIMDDILDIEGNTAELGKKTGSDEKKKKLTYPALFGVEQSRKKAYTHIENAIEAISHFSEKAEPLRAIARYIVERNH